MKLGSIQSEDVALIQAIIKMTKPSVLVEFGHLLGDSARAILEVMGDAKLISYDNTVDSKINDKRFVFRQKCQSEYNEPDFVDFVFIDASHILELNIATFNKLNLSNQAIVIVHDTGTWTKNFGVNRGYFKDNEYIHCPDERAFVNWIKDNHPEYQQIHFHTLKEARHGITILQKYKRLV